MLTIKICNINDYSKIIHTFSKDEISRIFSLNDGLRMQNNNPYELSGVLYPSMGDIWNLLFRENKYGIVLDTGWMQLPFYKYYPDTQNVSGKGVKLKFYSPIFRLSETFTVYAVGLYSGSFFAFITRLLGNQFAPVFHTADFTIEYEIGDKTNYDTFKEVCENHLISFRDNGIDPVSGLPQIAIGRGTDFPITNTDNRYKLLRWDSREQIQNQEIYVKQINQNFNNEGYTHCSPYLDNGIGSNIGQGLTITNASWLIQDFPIVTILIDDRKRNWVIHQKQLDSSGVVKAKTIPINLSPKLQDAVRGINTTVDGVQKNLYLQAVRFLRENSNVDNYGAEVEYTDIVLPISKIKLYYEENVTNTLGQNIQTMLVDTTLTRKEITYSGQQLAAMM